MNAFRGLRRATSPEFRARRSLADVLTAEPQAREKRRRPRLSVVQP
jgi:hypothetical protein